MDYFDARHYLDAMPLPMFIADQKSGHILYANIRAANKHFGMGGNIFLLLQNKADFLSWADLRSPTKSTVDLRIDAVPHRAQMVVCGAAYKGAKCLLITLTSMIKARSQSSAEVTSQICGIYTDSSRPKKTHDFLCVSANSVGAFCATLYEKRNKRYVMKEEWRQRKCVCVPLLHADNGEDICSDTARLRMLKRAKDAVCVPYTKQFGAQGAVVYYFDSVTDAHELIEKHVDIMARLSPDAPAGNSRAMIQKGLDALGEGIVIWDASSRKLLLANKAYRALFGYKTPSQLNDVLGSCVKVSAGKPCTEDYTDANGRFFKITHARSRYRGRQIVTSMIIDMTAQKNAESKLEAIAKTDALTGLSNRRAGIEHLRRVYADGKAAHKPLTVCFADIDGLKYINDTYGHGAGDSMIRAVADVLKTHVERVGAVCRLGGDEFVLILPNMCREQAVLLTVGIERDAAKCLVGQAQGITMSFGFKEADYGAKETADTLVNVADYEMYREKRKKSIR